jgi:hypothetical protein
MTTKSPASPDPPASRVAEPQSDFQRRGENSWQHYLLTGISMPASEVIDRLQAALDQARNRVLGESGD